MPSRRLASVQLTEREPPNYAANVRKGLIVACGLVTSVLVGCSTTPSTAERVSELVETTSTCSRVETEDRGIFNLESSLYPSPAPLIYSTRISCSTDEADEWADFHVDVFESEADFKEAAQWACLRGEDINLNGIRNKFENGWRVGASLLVTSDFSSWGSGKDSAMVLAEQLRVELDERGSSTVHVDEACNYSRNYG